MDQLRPSKAARAVAAVGVIVALASAGALALAGFGYRWGWWPLPDAFAILRVGTFVAGGGALVALIGAAWSWRRGARALAALALVAGVIGLGAASLPLLQLRTAKSVPPIHDITTDPVDPPAFEAVLPLRAGAANSAAYGGDAIAAQQHAAYPDIVPIRLDAAPTQAFTRALDAARAMGWMIVTADPARGTIEATDQTLWFGFKDDIAVRVRADGAGSVVDVRSLSRIGRSDVGTNARRIRSYRERLTGR
ncbi:MAG: DUF1499 domain-containing protein [Alphaproteobacteria bacterium]|nr:DUF1499 domain-containing protein [Alphaproteobacteria bacterium]